MEEKANLKSEREWVDVYHNKLSPVVNYEGNPFLLNFLVQWEQKILTFKFIFFSLCSLPFFVSKYRPLIANWGSYYVTLVKIKIKVGMISFENKGNEE